MKYLTKIEHIVVDTTYARTELCEIGALCKTDKSPYGKETYHRHPYTGVYTMLFAPLKHKPIQFAEIGIDGGASTVLWHIYFPKARLCVFDVSDPHIDNLKAMNFPEPRPIASKMDVSIDGDVTRALNDVSGGSLYDVILDDSSHDFNHQIRIIKEGFPLLKPGGMLIIEDVFRSTPEEDYERALLGILPDCVTAYFIVCNHEERYSPGWNNDKLLVLVKA